MDGTWGKKIIPPPLTYEGAKKRYGEITPEID